MYCKKLFIKSKIQFFESKSQLAKHLTREPMSCLSSQRYNFLKANHNLLHLLHNRRLVVYQVKDTIFWKQITTYCIFNIPTIGCLSSQRYNFLKANHNQKRVAINYPFVVYQVKDTIFWKQITTYCIFYVTTIALFIKSKIQFFESKSQHYLILSTEKLSCLSSQRYNFLKANHNFFA